MKNVHALRHEKEKNYYTFMMVVSVIVWLLCLVGVLAALVFCLPLILIDCRTRLRSCRAAD